MARRKNRSRSKISRLPPEIRSTVDAMVQATADFTYTDIQEYLAEQGVEISTSAIGTYARSLMESLEALTVAQETMRAMMETAANFVRSGKYKKVILVGADKMSSIVNYTDRATCPIFGDGAAAVMMEPTVEDVGVMDAILRTDGKGLPFLHLKAGGSVCPPSYFTIDNHMHYLYQEGRTVFKYAVSNMSDVSAAIAEKNHLTKDSIDWVIPHQANLRIIDAVAHRLEVPHEKVLINIEHYGNTSAGTLPLCLWDFEHKLKKGDNMIFTAFGAGFTWGAVYVKWGYDGKKW